MNKIISTIKVRKGNFRSKERVSLEDFNIPFDTDGKVQPVLFDEFPKRMERELPDAEKTDVYIKIGYIADVNGVENEVPAFTGMLSALQPVCKNSAVDPLKSKTINKGKDDEYTEYALDLTGLEMEVVDKEIFFFEAKA